MHGWKTEVWKLFKIAVFVLFSDHQQWIQPPFCPSVLASPLPLQVSLTRARAYGAK